MTDAEMLAGRSVNPGTVALATITAGTCASKAASNGASPPLLRLRHGWVAAAPRSELPLAAPSPGKCLTTGTTPLDASPAANASASREATAGSALNDLAP